MSASSSKPPSKHAHGSPREEKKSEGVDIQPKRPPTASRPQYKFVSRQFVDDVRDTKSREDGHGRSPLISNYGDGDAQRKAGSGIAPPKADQPPLIEMFQGAHNFQINNASFAAIGGNATIIQFGNEQFTEVQRNLIGDYIAEHIILPAINNNSKKHILTQLIINLPRAEAVFNDYQTNKKSGPCFEGTRVTLLREMADWATGQDESRMYILSGLAGIGKSTVAYTIASRAADLNLLGASFFFSRDDANRNNAKRLFTTIAYQLCVYDEEFAKAIGNALLTDHGSAAVTKGLYEQLRVLILEPLRSIIQSRVRPILVVVDALDECDESDVRAVIQGLGQLVQDLPSFKVVLTTRPQPLFDTLLSNKGGRKLFRLQDIEDKVVDNDIRLYLKHHLSLENVKMHFPKQQWHTPSDEQIDSFVHAAGRLFIVAATTVRYILDKSASNPAAQMQDLLGASAQNHTTFKDLNHFYTIILRNAVPANCDNDRTIKRYQSVVGAIILIQRPLPVSTLARLIGVDVGEIHAVLDHLQSVILLGDDDDAPRVYHKSFSDYLTDKSRCKDPRLQIDRLIGHTRIAAHCFEITDKHLKYNILGLGTPARFMDNAGGLRQDGITNAQLIEKIPQQLRYACVYWAAHLELGNIEDSEIVNGLDKFINGHMLHWFEVLSIIGQLDTAHLTIRAVLNFLKSASSDLHQLLSDALHFISKFYGIINRSVLHMYYSALPFSPSKSLLYRRYIQEAGHGVFNVEGGPQEWDALIAHLGYMQPSSLEVVKFSLNSTMLITYFNGRYDRIYGKPGGLKIWDAFTGTPISTIPGYTFAISSDFSTIASANENIITYYSHDGSTTGDTITTSSQIKRLALSSESDRIAAVLSDGIVCLWASRTGELIDSFDGCKCSYDGDKGRRYGHAVQFSPSGTRLAYSSGDDIIKLRDGVSGTFIADLNCGEILDRKLEFSADSSRVATLSLNTGLIIWNAENGERIGSVGFRHDYALGISANGSLLATGSLYDTTLWSENCRQQITLKCKHTQSIKFSPYNTLAISDYSGIRIYNIETETMSTFLPTKSQGPLDFSPDGTRLARGTHLCDAQAIHTSCQSSRASSVTTIALSRDCSRLACGFEDAVVELWETSPTMRHISSHKEPFSEHPKPRGISFGPDGRLLAFWASLGNINLRNSGDGSLFGILDTSSGSSKVALSNSVLIAIAISMSVKVTLWDLGTLNLVHTFKFGVFGKTPQDISISDEGDLAAIVFDYNIDLFDLENRTRIATFESNYRRNQTMTFLPDKSHLLLHEGKGKFLSVNLANKRITDEPLPDHLIQTPNISLWDGVPILPYHEDKKLRYFGVSFLKNQRPVPVLWIPTDINVANFTTRSSMIALGCEDGRSILLRLRTSHPIDQR